MKELIEEVITYEASDGRRFRKSTDCLRYEYLNEKFIPRKGKTVPQVMDTEEKLDCIWIENETEINEYVEWLRLNYKPISKYISPSIIQSLPNYVTVYDDIDGEYILGTVKQYYEYLSNVKSEIERVQSLVTDEFPFSI